MKRRDRTVAGRLHDHPWLVAGTAVVIAVGALFAVSFDTSWEAVEEAFTHVHLEWLALCAGAHVVAMGGYVVAYRSVVAMRGGPKLPLRLAWHIVIAGFGAFTAGGGFHLDQRALQAVHGDRRAAVVCVLGLGALEYALLAPAAAACSIILLATGSDVSGALLWPWAIAVPAGFAVGIWASAPRRRVRVPYRGRLLGGLRDTLEGIGLLRVLLRHPLQAWGAWIGLAVYWAAEIATLFAALKLFGADPGFLRVVLAYATGYAATRRTLPLGGAGVTEALLSLALLWVGLPLAKAIPAVVAYRAFTFLLPIVPTIRSHYSLKPLLESVHRRSARIVR